MSKGEDTRGAGWFKPKSFSVTFEALGYPQFWMELKEPGSHIYGDVKEPRLAPDSPSEEVDKAFSELIMGWNLTDPETGEDLPIPTPDDAASLERLPIEFINYIAVVVAEKTEEFRTEGVLKKASEISPEAISEAFKE